MILNLKRLNENMPYIHLKMETIKSILTLVTPYCSMAKLDEKDEYCFVAILPEHQKYLKFCFRGKLCQFTCLPNGLCSGPLKFIKLLKPPLSYLRLQQVTVAEFIDDLLTLMRNFVKCKRNIKLTVTLLDSPEFVVHPNNLNICPS